MEAEQLFLEVLDEIEGRVHNPGRTEYDLLQVASLLWQLLLDQGRLVDAANVNVRHRIQFYVSRDTASNLLPERGAVMLIEPYALWPNPTGDPRQQEFLRLDAFLKRRLLVLDDEAYSVRNMIDTAANSLGGRHLGRDKTDPKAQVLWDNNDTMINGDSLVVAHMSTIAGVVVNSLLPLRVQLRFRMVGESDLLGATLPAQ